MKKIMILLLSLTFLFVLSANVFANINNVYSEESRISRDGELMPGLIPLPDDYPVPPEIAAKFEHPDGFYINGDGVAARRPYGLSAKIIGRLYTGDIVWTQHETATADGYTWIHVDTDSKSNMGAVPDVWIVQDYLGDRWR